MSCLSFLSSHRLHSSHRAWIDPLPVQLDILLHELPHEKSDHGFHAVIVPSTGPNGAEPVETGFISLKAA